MRVVFTEGERTTKCSLWTKDAVFVELNNVFFCRTKIENSVQSFSLCVTYHKIMIEWQEKCSDVLFNDCIHKDISSSLEQRVLVFTSWPSWLTKVCTASENKIKTKIINNKRTFRNCYKTDFNKMNYVCVFLGVHAYTCVCV